LVVDDHPVVREGLKAVLDLMPEFAVVGEASDGDEAISAFHHLRPDVTVMDLRLPKRSGIEACRAILSMNPAARILALTSSTEALDVKETLKAGVAGFILKGASGGEVADAIRRVHLGERPLSPEVVEQLAHLDTQCLPTPLTRREMDILDLLARGLRNQEIAEQLALAIGTVKVHVNNILDKLGARDRTEAAMLAIRKGLVRL
jgi:two-component system NarL family response regulator